MDNQKFVVIDQEDNGNILFLVSCNGRSVFSIHPSVFEGNGKDAEKTIMDAISVVGGDEESTLLSPAGFQTVAVVCKDGIMMKLFARTLW